MEGFTTHQGIVAPLARANVDTDAIIPKQYLKSIRRSGFAPCLFDDWRYLDSGDVDSDHSKRRLNPDFILNKTLYQKATILLTQHNFGCGSSREHAPWALYEFGFRVIIAPSFADIFANNCSKNGILLITLPQAQIDRLFAVVASHRGFALTVDLPAQTITPAPTPDTTFTDTDHWPWSFTIDAPIKHRLLHGLDDIALTLSDAAAIDAFEQRHFQRFPWARTGTQSVR